MYSPVSGLKVVRWPSDFHKDSGGDSGSEGALDSASPHAAQPYRAGPTTTTTSGPGPMTAPPLLEAINRNALAVFLRVRSSLSLSLHVRLKMDWMYVGQANVATGVVNLSMQTMDASDGRAMAVLAAYAFGVCVFAWEFRGGGCGKL
jgi:hypothetical protein